MRQDASRHLEELIQRMAHGDARALAHLYDRTSPTIFGLVRRIVGETGEAEEVAQEVYTQVWRSAKSFDPARGAALAWITMIARSRSLDRLRSRASYAGTIDQLSSLATEPPADEIRHAEEEASLAERRELVNQALSVLPEEQLEAIRLAFFSGLSHAEISRATSTPLGTVKSRIRAAVGKLEETLGPAVRIDGAE